MLFTKGETDILTLQEKVENALYAVAHGMNLNLLDTPVRERLLIALDTLSLIWERLRQMPEGTVLPARQAHLLYTLCEISEIARYATSEETQRLSEVIVRLARGITERSIPQVSAPTQQVAVTEAEQTRPPVPVEPVAEEEIPVAPSAPEAEEAVQGEETPQAELTPQQIPSEAAPAEQPVSPAPTEPTTPAEPEPVPYAGLAEKMDELSAVLDDIANHNLPREKAVARLMYSASLHRCLRPQATGWQREWELEQVKRQIEQLSDKKRMGVWLPPFDPNIEFSDHELETLAKGYRALDRSWDMWEWYKQYGADMDKGVGAPLLESIAAPIPMIQQIYGPKGILPSASEQDTTSTLREEVTEEAKRRKWKLDMLTMTCSRQQQVKYLNQAEENWQNAKAQVEKKQAQSRVLDALEDTLAHPDPSSFEEDLLCALVRCHKAQIPPSNLRLRELMRGYAWLVENPAVPDRCELSTREKQSARTFLVKLGEYLVNDQQKGQEDEEPETEPEAEQNGDLLKRARQITQGKKVLMLCFNRRAEAEQRIQQKLGFSEVDWPDLDGSESVHDMEPHIRNADMTIVVVRYSRTHWKEASDIAKQHNKQFVMATKGYGVTHLADAIVQQCQAGG